MEGEEEEEEEEEIDVHWIPHMCAWVRNLVG